MGIQEKSELKKTTYNEAMRYMTNAKQSLQKAGKSGKYYNDKKYVKTGAAIAYSGMLLALDTLLMLKDVKPPRAKRKSIEWYRDHLRKIDLKLLNEVNTAYDVLHLLGYYEGFNNADVINAGLDSAFAIINRIKPH